MRNPPTCVLLRGLTGRTVHETMSWEGDYYGSIQQALEAILEALESDFGQNSFDEAARAVANEEHEEALINFAETLVEYDRAVDREVLESLLERAEEAGVDDSDVVISFRAWVEDQAA